MVIPKGVTERRACLELFKIGENLGGMDVFQLDTPIKLEKLKLKRLMGNLSPEWMSILATPDLE